MIPFLLLLFVYAIEKGLGWIGIHALGSGNLDLRIALAVMFLFTASAHWGQRRRALIAMVPPGIPSPSAMVTVTGLLEMVGAIGLLTPWTFRLAGIGLAMLLLAIFPANVHAAHAQIEIRGVPRSPLWLRATVQLIFIALCLKSAFG